MKGYVIQEVGQPEDGLRSTAIDDFATRHCDEDMMILHLFQHTGINMGLDDVKLDNFAQGLAYYKTHNQAVTIRNAGGRSVVADQGVLNLSLIFHRKSLNEENYQLFYDLIADALAPYTDRIEVGEIAGAYCPGNTDMSLDGRKFCGVAQRRIGKVAAVVAYISVTGDQQARGELVKGFYQVCNTSKLEINPAVMASLDHLLQIPLSVDDVCTSLIKALRMRVTSLSWTDLNFDERADFTASLKRTMAQNRKIQSF